MKKIDNYEKSNSLMKMMINVICRDNFFCDKQKYFYSIPDAFQSMHWFLAKFLYPYIDFNFIKQHIKSSLFSYYTDTSILQFNGLNEFFIPNLAFIYFCNIKYDYWAKQLCDWELINANYYIWAFEKYYNDDYKMRKYFLNMYIMTMGHFDNFDNFDEHFSEMREFIYSKIEDAINNDNLYEAVFACNSLPKFIIFNSQMTDTEKTKLYPDGWNLVIWRMYNYLYDFPYNSISNLYEYKRK